jgi:predicted signal transduction protein with EAL and GGDEF domain
VAHTLAQPFLVADGTFQIGASVGYASHPTNAADDAGIMRAADVALHYAKLHARGQAVAFRPSMETERQTRQRIEARLRTALANSEFDLHFQPVVEAAGGRLRGFEALLRLSDDAGQPISPAEFIPVAEEVGLIGEIGIWVLREACRVARQWPDELFVAVNLSPAQFAQAGMAGRVRDALDWSGLKPRRLELEVTESLLITDSDKVLGELKAIKALGATLALDDFGTGYSSLSYLWRFPFDKLKVDRSFMAELTTPEAKSRDILSTIIALGRVLNLTITAEGVETEAQAAALRELDCDLVQGYLFGRPEPATAVAATILKAFGTVRRGRKPIADAVEKGTGS